MSIRRDALGGYTILLSGTFMVMRLQVPPSLSGCRTMRNTVPGRVGSS
jgi:hypothetical protein